MALQSGSYRVSEREAGKGAQRDQSFRNCMATMFIFLVLCIILVLVTLPWRKARQTTSEVEKNRPSDSEGLGGTLSTTPKNKKSEENISTHREKNITKIPETTARITTELPVSSSTGVFNNNKTILEGRNTFEDDSSNMTKSTIPLEAETTASSEVNSTETDGNILNVTLNEVGKILPISEATSVSTEITEASKDQETDESPVSGGTETSEVPTMTTLSTDVTKMSEYDENVTEINIYTRSEASIDAETRPPSSETPPWTSETPESFGSTVNYSESSANFSESTTINLTKDFNDETSSTTTDQTQTDTPESSSAIFAGSDGGEDTFSSTQTSRMTEEQFSTTAESFSTEDDDFLVSSTSSAVPGLEEGYSAENRRGTTSDFYFMEESTPPGSSLSSEQFDTTTDKGNSKNERTTSLLGLVVRTYLGQDSTELTDFPGNWLESADATPSGLPKTTTADAQTSFSSNQSTHLPDVSSTARVIDMVETLTSSKYASTRGDEILLTMNQKIEKAPEDNATVCVSGRCKQLTSRMLSFMNHSADPCEDFYEYACGGMEADSERNNRDLASQSLDRIKDSMKKHNSSSFKAYFDSCLEHYQYTTHEEKIKNVKAMLSNVGKFYTASDWPENYSGITELIANMMLHNSPLLFDITLDTNELNPEKFILKLSPPLGNNPLYFPEHDSCFESHQDIEGSEVDLLELFNNYKSCKKNANKIMDSVFEALNDLGVFNHLPNAYNTSQYLRRTVIDIDLEIVNKSLSHYPGEAEILKAHKSKIFGIMTLGALDTEFKLLNWTELLFTLTGKALKSDTEVQIYFKDELDRVLSSLGTFGQRHKLELNNALLGLYARDLYDTLVKGRSRDVEQQCLLTASRLLPEEASALYISSFPAEEIKTMNFTVHKVFGDLKHILKSKFERIKWAEESREQLLEKLDKIQLLTPGISHVSETFAPTVANNYVTSTVQLMKRLRETMYNKLEQNPHDHKQLWTFFAKSFQSSSQSIYGLSLILVPYGAIDWNLQENYVGFDYLTLASIGALVAREIAHHFDANGISYWNGMRSISSFSDPIITSIYDQYVDCHNHWLFPEPIEFYLPVPSMTLNQRLADATGLLIARSTLDEFNSEKILPWLNLSVHQLFYLAYAQTLCTKTPLTTSYVSLYEEGLLPSRVRIFATAINNQQLGRAWQCPEGSRILPSSSCIVFPDLDIAEDSVLSV